MTRDWRRWYSKETRKRYEARSCELCGKTFEPVNPDGRFCGTSCSAKWRQGLIAATIEERFWARVKRGKINACWEFQGYRNPLGYGYASLRGRVTAAHRMAYYFGTGVEPPKHLEVCHVCDNPPCCNPAHLWLGTHADNMRDMAAKNHARGGRRKK